LRLCAGATLADVAVAVLTALRMAAVRGTTDGTAVQAWVYLPVAVVASPLVLLVMPTTYRWPLPGDLRRAGAPTPVVRATCAVVFPLAFLTLGLLCYGFFTTFPGG
jgi:hypothetical protein